MSNSPLATYTHLSPNHSGRRTHAIDRISPHCVVGQASARRIAEMFPAGRDASCNYAIGKDGDIALVVEEKNRSWCTSSNSNDQRAVTIECASDTFHPYAMTNAVYRSLVNLCVDICRRNGKSKLIWFGDANRSLNYSPKSNEMVLTVHRWFAQKACPGDWLYSRLGSLASEVTKKLVGTSANPFNIPNPKQTQTVAAKPLPSGNFLYEVTIDDLNIRTAPNGTKTGKYTGKGKFTIVEKKDGWGRLKSGAGWISLDPEYGRVVSTGATPAKASAKPQKASSEAKEDGTGINPMYRVYNPDNGDHLHTESARERDSLIKSGWKDEGTAWMSGRGAEVYRITDPETGEHLLTKWPEERDALKAAGWIYEGVAMREGSKYPVYRLYPEGGFHMLTKLKEERDALVKAGYKLEGIAFHVN